MREVFSEVWNLETAAQSGSWNAREVGLEMVTDTQKQAATGAQAEKAAWKVVSVFDKHLVWWQFGAGIKVLNKSLTQRSKCPLCHCGCAVDIVWSYNDTIHLPWEHKLCFFLLISSILKVRTRLRSPPNKPAPGWRCADNFQGGFILSASKAPREPISIHIRYKAENSIFKENNLYHSRGKIDTEKWLLVSCFL